MTENSIKCEEERAAYANEKKSLNMRVEKLVARHHEQHRKLERFASLVAAQTSGVEKLKEAMCSVNGKFDTFKRSHKHLKASEMQQKETIAKLQARIAELEKQSAQSNGERGVREKETEFLKVI